MKSRSKSILGLLLGLTVAESLVRSGISPSRIATRGFGPRSPAAPNDTEEGRRRNRRVEVIIEN